MSHILFLRGFDGDYAGYAAYRVAGVEHGIDVAIKEVPDFYNQYEFLMWFALDADYEKLERQTGGKSALYNRLKTETSHSIQTWWREGELWHNVLGATLPAKGENLPCYPVAKQEQRPGPRKPPPALPVEVWNAKKFDMVTAWEELQSLCKGT